jgi:hypothetical protein
MRPGGEMSESYGTGDEREEPGELDVEENRDDDEDEEGGYGASEQGDAGVEGPGDQSGMGELDEEDENLAD